jgi:hypothetical protein
MALADNKAPVTGNPDDTVPDKAKYGLARDPGDGAAAARASELNNAEPALLELADGRCPVDGLPPGNCGHFPGPHQVIAPDGGTVYEEGHAPQETETARGQGSRKEPRQS